MLTFCLLHLHAPQKREDEQSTETRSQENNIYSHWNQKIQLDMWRMGCSIGVSRFQKEEKQG
jgi:hypothetical protein